MSEPDRTAEGDGATGSGTDHGGELVRKEPPVKEGKEQAWRFLRTLSGVLLVAWLLPAMVAPPDPFTFFLWLVPSWSVGILLAVWLVYRDGFSKLAASNLYSPGLAAGRALAFFVGTTLALKLVFTFLTNVLVGSRPYEVDVGLSVVALALAYLAVYQGALARKTGLGDGKA